MIYDTGEYRVKLKIPTDNFVFYHFWLDQALDIHNFKETIKSNIPNSDTLIILFGGFHNLNNHDFWFPVLNQLVKEIPNPVVVFDGNLSKANKVTPEFYYYPVSMFERVSVIFFKEQLYNETAYIRRHHASTFGTRHPIYGIRKNNGFGVTRPKKFYWASSKDWVSRRYLLSGLIKNNLLEDNYVNYKCVISMITERYLETRFSEECRGHIKEECQSIDHLVPLPPLDDTIEFNLTDRRFYDDTYCSIITDTFFDFGPFLSEKVFNAMLHGHIFLFLGSPRTLAWLRNKGYSTFDSIIDTSYDLIDDNGLRLIEARKSILNFLNRPIEKIKEDYIKVLPELRHNKNLVLKQRPDLEIRDIFQNILNEHRKTNSNIS